MNMIHGREEQELQMVILLGEENNSNIFLAILLLAEILPEKTTLVMELLKLIVPDGLKDRMEPCRNLMRKAATITIKNVCKNV
jgi:hypothetical protein